MAIGKVPVTLDAHTCADKFVKLGLLDKATEVELREIFALRKRETEVSLEVMELEDKLRKISADQREVRNNLDTLFKGQKEVRLGCQEGTTCLLNGHVRRRESTRRSLAHWKMSERRFRKKSSP